MAGWSAGGWQTALVHQHWPTCGQSRRPIECELINCRPLGEQSDQRTCSSATKQLREHSQLGNHRRCNRRLRIDANERARIEQPVKILAYTFRLKGANIWTKANNLIVCFFHFTSACAYCCKLQVPAIPL